MPAGIDAGQTPGYSPYDEMPTWGEVSSAAHVSNGGGGWGDQLGAFLLDAGKYAVMNSQWRKNQQYIRNRNGDVQEAGDIDPASDVIQTSRNGNAVTLSLPMMMLIGGGIMLAMSAGGGD